MIVDANDVADTNGTVGTNETADANDIVDTNGIVDSHAHYEANQFDSDRDELLSKTLPEQGVQAVINMGSDLDACYKTVKLTRDYDYIYGAVGIHPECAQDLPEDWFTQVENLLSTPKIVAVGEIGLDYHYLEYCPKEKQLEVFARQLELAKRLDLPVIVHDREAHGDTLKLLEKYRPRGVVHCFSGSLEFAREVIRIGMYIGFGGTVTFKNALKSAEVATAIPLERLLLETDAPYLAPVPYRGRRNDSSKIKYVATKIGELRGIPADAVLLAVKQNTEKLFQIQIGSTS